MKVMKVLQKKLSEKISDTVLCTSEQIEIETIEDVDKFIMSGFAVVAVDGYAKNACTRYTRF